MITPGELHDLESLAAIEPEWRLLWDSCLEATPFQHPAWLLPWCRHFAPHRLSVITLRRGGRLVGLLPAFERRESPVSTRALALLGEGITDYLDALFDPAHLEEAIATLGVHLAERGEACDFEALRDGSALLRVPAPRGSADVIKPSAICPVLVLPARDVGLESVVPKETLRNVRRARVRAAALGQLTNRLADTASRGAMIEALFALHSARWSDVGETGVLGGRAIRAFHDEASTALLDAGLLRLFGVYLDEAPIASLIALFARGRAYLYLQGFDPAFERLSPGLLATACAIDQAFVEGTMVVDFLRGQERYKYLWGAHDELTYRRILTPI
jgi:CelD/BcsL family acetyltransferase involved in cellulose biosynthesis